METFLDDCERLRFLLIADVNMVSATNLSEVFVPLPPQFDGILVVGPFGLGNFKSPEETAIALGDMASTLAQLENIVCRVIYLPTESEPDRTMIDQLHLTPNSVNIHGRRLDIIQDIHIIGFAERNEQSICGKACSAGNESDIVEIVSTNSAAIIEKLVIGKEDRFLDSDIEGNFPNACSKNDKVSQGLGILILHYQYAHTLNTVLFHLSEKLEAASIKLCIIASQHGDELDRLPLRIGDVSIVGVKSLSNGYFTSLEFQKQKSGTWSIVKVELHRLS